MPTRPATYADLLPASRILARAFNNEALLGEYMHPYRKQYPNDMYLFFLNKLRLAWAAGPSEQIIISYKLDSRPSDRESVTGAALWKRNSATEDRTGWIDAVRTAAVNTYIYLESFLWPNRAADPSRLGFLSSLEPYGAHFWTGSRAEVWDLVLLGVDPMQGNQGFGKQLVGWGFEQARKEGVGCSVVGADGTEPFYRSCGFDQLAGYIADNGGEENPVVREKIPGGVVLFWDNGRSLDGVKKYGEK